MTIGSRIYYIDFYWVFFSTKNTNGAEEVPFKNEHFGSHSIGKTRKKLVVTITSKICLLQKVKRSLEHADKRVDIQVVHREYR